VGFLIEVPTSSSSMEILAKKRQMAYTKRYPPKEIGQARPIFISKIKNKKNTETKKFLKYFWQTVIRNCWDNNEVCC